MSKRANTTVIGAFVIGAIALTLSAVVLLGTGQCRFSVWAPTVRQVELRIIAPQERVIPLDRTEGGYHLAVVDHIEPGTLYTYRLDGAVARPDPVSSNTVFGSILRTWLVPPRMISSGF